MCIKEDKIDVYLKDRDIEGLYKFMMGKESSYELNHMLETWSMEKTRQEKTIFWNVFSMEDVKIKYQKINKCMLLILDKVDLQEELHEFVYHEISVWAALVWILTCKAGMKKLSALEIFMDFMKQYRPEDMVILKAVYEQECKTIVEALCANGNAYLALQVQADLKLDDNQRMLLQEEVKKEKDKIKSRLYTPTSMERIDEQYYIVDCWHDRVIYSDRLCDIEEWKILDEDLKYPHSICKGKGGIYAVENTEKGLVCFYKKSDEGFTKIDEIFAGKRPHRILYDENRDIFWILASYSQEIFGVRLVHGQAKKCCQQRIEELQSSYARSMRMICDKFYIVSGPGVILQLSFSEDKFTVEQQYPVPARIAGMNDIIFYDGYFWISSYQNHQGEVEPALIKIRKLEDFETGNYEDLYNSLGMKGVPYYFSWIDGKLCIPEIDAYSRIVLYDVNHGELKVNQVLYDFGKAEKEDIDYMKYHERRIKLDFGECRG